MNDITLYREEQDNSSPFKALTTLVLTGSEGGADARSHQGSKQHVQSQDILCIMGHVLQVVVRGAAIQSQLPGTVPPGKLCKHRL